MFNAIFLTNAEVGTRSEFRTLQDEELPAGDVRIRVEYSGLNYKDALAITGRGAVIRKWPAIPGIDLAGVVEASSDPAWTVGEQVVITGWGLGESHWGGLAQRARVPGAWLLRRPASFDARSAMAVGTAGFTAALSVMALQGHGLKPGDGEVLVTGAAGGVGSIAIALLAGLGFSAVASTGRTSESEYLRRLGAARVMDRSGLAAAGKPLQAERWAGVIDTVGSQTLANACATTRMGGALAACGLAQGADFPGTVLPFILRGVTLYGINSVYVDNSRRTQAWNLLSDHLRTPLLEAMTTQIPLSQTIEYCPALLAGRVRGRTVVDVNR